MIDGFLVAVTVFSVSMATIMAVLTWRVIRLNRPQTAARGEVGSRVARRVDEPTDALEPPVWPPIGRHVRNRDQVRGGNRRFAIAIGIGALVVMSAIGSALVFSQRPAGLAFVSPAAAGVTSPLELVSLDSARDGDRVTIHGLVKNPATGTRVEHLQAVIFLFDRRGMYLGTTHAAVAQDVLPPGSESSFEVPLAAGLQVSRYRVSFRVPAAPMPHVDRRPVPTPAPEGSGGGAVEQRTALAVRRGAICHARFPSLS